MNATKLFWMLALVSFADTAWAYGSSSSKKACEKPRFSEFSPPDKATVQPESAFSFIASGLTDPKTLKVAVKDQPVPISINPVNQGYQVKGTLPAALKGTFARISISAEGTNRCKGSGGWLVNILE
ncbi:MAG: hypothetical protein ACU83O_11050 [Gammaproteobacteria bacterium]